MDSFVSANVVFTNWIIGELLKDKPFNLVLNAGDVGSMHSIAVDMKSEWLISMLEQRVRTGTGIQIEVNQENADKIYHVLSSYLLKVEGV